MIFIFGCNQITAQWQSNGNAIYNTNNGNVGIGISNPIKTLDVNGNVNIRGWDAVYSTINGEGDITQLIGTYQGWDKNTIYIAGYHRGNSEYSAKSVSFGGYGTERLWINLLNGNVGIGTKFPSNKLTVDGCIRMKTEYDNDGSALLGSLANGNYFFALNSNTDGSFYMYDCTGGVWHKSITSMNGNIGIGTTTPGAYKLNVAGTIRANEIVVNTTGADFVFAPDYKLLTLTELETFIKTNQHLPGIAPAKEMQENGVSAGEMQTKLLQKVEELTLYVIELKKENEQLKNNSEKQQKMQNELIGKQMQLLLQMKEEIESLKKHIDE